MSEGEIQVAIHPAPEGGFWAEVEGCPGCLTQAANQTEALARLRDAHALWSSFEPEAIGAGSGLPPVGSTAGALAEALDGAGWHRQAESEHHLLFIGGGGERLTLPRLPLEPLKDGYRAALERSAS